MNGEVEELVVSGAEEVVSVVDNGELTGAATCWASAEPHRASKATTLKERWVNRVVGRVFIVSINNQVGSVTRQSSEPAFPARSLNQVVQSFDNVETQYTDLLGEPSPPLGPLPQPV